MEANFLKNTLNSEQTKVSLVPKNILGASLPWVYNIICTSNYISSYDLVMSEEQI